MYPGTLKFMETKLFQKVTHLSEYMAHACRITNSTKMFISIGRFRPSDKGGGGQSYRARGKEGAWPFGPQFGLKIRGGAGQTPQAPPLDLPLVRSYHWVNKKYLYSYIIKDI